MPSTTSKTKLGHSWQFKAIGTRWSIETRLPLGTSQQVITERIEMFDHVYSRFRDDSLVTKISTHAGEYEFPADVEEIVELYQKLYDVTDHAVSPLVGNILDAAGYDKEYSLKPRDVHPAPEWDEVMKWSGSRVTMKQPALLDFGAAGKGYLVDIIAGLLDENGHEDYVIDASGDILTRGRTETIGLENLYDPTRIIGTVPVQNASLCASATNRRVWGNWHHIIDPRMGLPVRDIVATWVIAPTTLEADGLATALFFVAAETLSDWNFQYVRLFADGTVERSDDFVGELFI